MPQYVAFKKRRGASGKNAEPPSVEQLFQFLVQQLAAANGSTPPKDLNAEPIILRAELDGFSYAVVRLPKSSRVPVKLSPREHEIVRMVAQGHPNKVIAGVLNISSWTVCTHLRRIFGKLGVGSRAAMVARFLEFGTVWDNSAGVPLLEHRALTDAANQH